jgi:hypothetical protein
MNEKSASASHGASPETFDEPQVLLAFMSPDDRQRRLALAIVLVLFIVFVVTAPFTFEQIPTVTAFIPTLNTAVFINDLITSSLLFAQFTISRSHALLVLASGFLFTALIVIPQSLTFQGAFTSTCLLGAGLQSAVWLYFFWHFGFTLAVIGYVLLKDADRVTADSQGSARAAVGSSVLVILALVGGLTWLATAEEGHLPMLVGDDLGFWQPRSTGIVMLLSSVLALALLWFRRRSVLDLWLVVVMCALVFEVARIAVGGGNRFSLGYYVSRTMSGVLFPSQRNAAFPFVTIAARG